MPGLKTTLANYDLDFLKRIARRWGVEISTRDTESARADLKAGMADEQRFKQMWETLDEATQIAWASLARSGGKLPWLEFSRAHGEIRDFGPARREREEPDLSPISAAETLWYSGLAGRAFLKTAGEPIEFFYIPDEILTFASIQAGGVDQIQLRPATSQQPKYQHKTSGAILDHLTDMLAALRMQREIQHSVFEAWGMPRQFLSLLLQESGLVNNDLQLVPDALKSFFSARRGAIHARIFQVWLESGEINDLRMLPGLKFEGTWKNNPRPPRNLLISLLSRLDAKTWWSISSLLAGVKDKQPDFQRAAGDYDSWFIRQEGASTYLSGFENWDKVEGALLAHLLSGPLHWFGVVHLAASTAEGRSTAFQLSDGMLPLLSGLTPEIGVSENHEIKIKDARHITIPNQTSRLLRYQVARFCELVSVNQKESHYAITTNSLNSAAEQGLQLSQLMQLLEKEGGAEIPDSLRKMARRWSSQGKEAVISKVSLLRFQDAAACAEFNRFAAGRFTLEELNPRTLLITERQKEGVIRVLNELGILVDIEADV